MVARLPLALLGLGLMTGLVSGQDDQEIVEPSCTRNCITETVWTTEITTVTSTTVWTETETTTFVAPEITGAPIQASCTVTITDICGPPETTTIYSCPEECSEPWTMTEIDTCTQTATEFICITTTETETTTTTPTITPVITPTTTVCESPPDVTTTICEDQPDICPCPDPSCPAGAGCECPVDPCDECEEKMECLECTNCATCPDCPQCNCCEACDDCETCPQCPQCVCPPPPLPDKCHTCEKCTDCPECPQCTCCDACVDCNECPQCPLCDCCGTCTDCTNCPQCPPCEKGPCEPCIDCDACIDCTGCPDCAKCECCETCDNCEECPQCEQCQDPCKTCIDPDCEACPDCDVCIENPCITCIDPDCEVCPDCDVCKDPCKTCIDPDCEACPDCDICKDSPCTTCIDPDCEVCPSCPQCDCDACTNCDICPTCDKCTDPCQVCNDPDCEACPSCPQCDCDACVSCQDCMYCEKCKDIVCDNEGLTWAYYPAPIDWAEPGTFSQNFETEYFKDMGPSVTDVRSEEIFPISTGCESGNDDVLEILDHTLTCSYFALQFRGYIFADVAGEYEFLAGPDTDDVILIWAGPDAVEGWNSANAMIDIRYPDTAEQQAAYSARAGEYVPIRVMTGQKTGIYRINMYITGPSGRVTLLQYPCDSSKAAAFPPFGQEI